MDASVRDAMAGVARNFGLEPSVDQMDRVAATLRDAFCAREVDPTDPKVLEGALFGSWVSLCQVLSVPWSGSSVTALWVQAEVLRRWLDGEMHVLSAQEMLHVPGV